MIPDEYITCPGCGLKYGHHNTKVDTISEECATCVKKMDYKQINMVTAEEFIKKLYNI